MAARVRPCHASSRAAGIASAGSSLLRGILVGYVPAMTTARSLLLFALAALFEIGGAWLVWQGWREHRGLWWVAAGVVVLGGTAVSPPFSRMVTSGASSPGTAVCSSSVRWCGVWSSTGSDRTGGI